MPPAARDVTTVREALDRHGTVVAYEGGRRLRELREVIELAGGLDRAGYAEYLGTTGRRVVSLSEVDTSGDGPYLSTAAVLPSGGGRGEQL